MPFDQPGLENAFKAFYMGPANPGDPDPRPSTPEEAAQKTAAAIVSAHTDAAADLSDYCKLSGRAGGQTVYGGTAAGENLNLHSTSHATRGYIGLAHTLYVRSSAVGIGISSPANPLDILTGDTSNSAMHVGEYANQGFWLTTLSANNAILSAGARLSAGTWYASATAAAGYQLSGEDHLWYYANGLTAGGSLSWSVGMRLDANKLTIGSSSAGSNQLNVYGGSNGALAMLHTTLSGGDAVFTIQNAGDSNANTNVIIRALQSNRYGGDIVFGRDNAYDWLNNSGVNFANIDGYMSFAPVYNGQPTERLRLNSTSYHRLTTSYGYLDIGPGNTDWCHFSTNRSKFYFNVLTGHRGGIAGYDSDLSLRSRYTSNPTLLIATNSIYPNVDNSFDVGTATKRWDDIYATNGTIQTSDETQKRDIEPCNLGLDWLNQVQPIMFRWKSIQNIRPAAVNHVTPQNRAEFLPAIDNTLLAERRRHYGFSAQQIASLVPDTKDFAAVCVDKDTGRYGLRSQELIPILVKAIQELSDKVEVIMNPERAALGAGLVHANSPVSCSAVAQRFAVDERELYNFVTDGTGDVLIKFGDDTVTATPDGVGCHLIRADSVYCPYTVPNDATHVSILGYNSTTPKLFIEKQIEVPA